MNPFEDHDLDSWLAAGTAALDADVAAAVDLEAGLADIRLTERFVTGVSAVLDLDAGLAAVLPRPAASTAPPEPAVLPGVTAVSRAALHGFADRFAARPPHERISARAWLPRAELASARSFTLLLAEVREFDHELVRARDVAVTERVGQRLGVDFVQVRTALRDRARELRRDRALPDVLDRAVLCALDLGFGLDLGRARDAAHDLSRAAALVSGVDRALFLAVTTAADHARGRTTARAEERLTSLLADLDRDVRDAGPLADLDPPAAGLRAPDHRADAGAARFDHLVRRLEAFREVARDAVLDRDRRAADLLARALGQACDLALDQARGRIAAVADDSARALVDALATPGPHDGLADAVDRVTRAVTDVVDADLADVPLDGIPLGGLRWSTGTRWHPAWRERVRRTSVEVRPGLYEVRDGAVDVLAT